LKRTIFAGVLAQQQGEQSDSELVLMLMQTEVHNCGFR